MAKRVKNGQKDQFSKVRIWKKTQKRVFTQKPSRLVKKVQKVQFLEEKSMKKDHLKVGFQR